MNFLQTSLALIALARLGLAIPAPFLLSRAITGLPQAEVVCPDTRDGSDPATQTVSFNDFQAEDAAQRGMFSEPGSSDANPGGYSREYRNSEQFVFANCNSGTLYEYPILAGGNVYGGGPPGPFRVIFKADPDFASRNGIYCGILYHPRNADGSESGLFRECT